MQNSTPPSVDRPSAVDVLFAIRSVVLPSALAAAVSWGLGGCASVPDSAPSFPDSAFRAAAPGDWDDIDAAVEIGGGQAEWVIAQWWSAGEATRFYRLRNPLGTEALLRIRKPAETGPLEITASIGPLGDAAAERTLVERITRRLGQLRGVDAAEIR